MTTPPSPLEEQAEISLQESRRSDYAHYVYQDGHWTKAGMRAHPVITVCVSMDKSWCRTRHGPIVARNVPAIADTGAQTDVWSLRHFLAAGFDRSILIPASDLVAANHSGINIIGAFFAVIKGLDANKTEVQCHAMIYVSADISHLYLSPATLADLGVLSPQFPLIGEHPTSRDSQPGLCHPTPHHPFSLDVWWLLFSQSTYRHLHLPPANRSAAAPVITTVPLHTREQCQNASMAFGQVCGLYLQHLPASPSALHGWTPNRNPR